MPLEDFQKAHRQHYRYSQNAKKWAARVVNYVELGMIDKAKAAQVKCEYWLTKAMEIEKLYKRRNPHE